MEFVFNLLISVLLVISSSTGIQAQQQSQPEENRYVVTPATLFSF